MSIDYAKTQSDSLDESYAVWQRMMETDALYRDAQSENLKKAQAARADLAMNADILIDYKQHRSEYLSAYSHDDKDSTYSVFDDTIMRDGYQLNMQSEIAAVRDKQAESMKLYESVTGRKLTAQPVKSAKGKNFDRGAALDEFVTSTPSADNDYQK